MKVLFAGESWTIAMSHIKGFNSFETFSYDESTSDNIRRICDAAGIEFHFMPSHTAMRHFPGLDGLKEYDVVVLSDIGSDTFLLHPETFEKSLVRENRLLSLCRFVEEGGGLAMFGGWNSFTGMAGKARYGMTPLKNVLPVELYPYDDRNEVPEGATLRVVKPEHPIFAGVDLTWPPLLGYNRLMPKAGAEVLAVNDSDVMIAVQEIGKGRSFAFASDISAHWAPPALTGSEAYARFIINVFRWLGNA